MVKIIIPVINNCKTKSQGKGTGTALVNTAMKALERLADQGIWEAKKALEDLENS